MFEIVSWFFLCYSVLKFQITICCNESLRALVVGGDQFKKKLVVQKISLSGCNSLGGGGRKFNVCAPGAVWSRYSPAEKSTKLKFISKESSPHKNILVHVN